ncbi:MAG TPA: NAD(P)H-dependent glycerol-3-phosphate dehydrogenase [Oligoflexia bacterium]|nr:NAD(P)H-dependent glycerol-3-phosphate dehydrogenase [Oligoflexia bacterium]HMR25701.1 NAD(P)H-dependent glycerol-3-phosphate dehydrogenase [Oligoflexia bacterium]
MNILVLGTGSWGTALASVLAKNGNNVLMWSRNSAQVDHLKKHSNNTTYHPNISLPSNIAYTSKHTFKEYFDIIVYACPSHAVNNILSKLELNMNGQTIFVSTAKGIDNTSLKTVSQSLVDLYGMDWLKNYFATLSGPSFAHDVIRQKPTAVTVATYNYDTAIKVQEAFHCPTFHTYRTDDVIGVELAGALKNVIAIAAGVCDGLELGPSARSALITRGLAEIIKIGLALGAKVETFSGLAGLGDLLLTCTSDLSRNRRVGKMIASGLSLRQTIKQLGQVAEGIRTTKSAYKLLNQHDIQSVIIKQIYLAIYEDKPLKDALNTILYQDAEQEI